MSQNSFTLKRIGAGDLWSEHPYTQWVIVWSNGFAVANRNGKPKRFDSERAAQLACDKLNNE